ncbi:MAG TPA: cupin domain-containing protein [Thermomicrobiales bacterium]|nr:cupin domain-containing protein [Thermomicrobiales bacterium]
MTNTAIRPYARKPEIDNSSWYQGSVLLSYLATSQDTGGQFTLIELHSRQGDGPLPHIHPDEDEYFYVLEGEMAFDIDGQRYPAPSGSFVMIPRGTLHQPLLVSDEARALMLFTPGGAEGYFQEMSEPARALTLPPEDAPPPDLDRMARIATKYGVLVPEGDGAASAPADMERSEQ